MNHSQHDPLICGLDWVTTCDHCRTLDPSYKPPPVEQPLAIGSLGMVKKEAAGPAPSAAMITVHYDEILIEGRAAFKVLLDTGQEVWLPFGHIENGGEDYRAGYKNGSMQITAWIARQKGINEGSQEPNKEPEEYGQDGPEEDFDTYEGYDHD